MTDVIELPRTKTLRLVKEAGRDSAVSLAASQALVDIFVSRGIITDDDFYRQLNIRLQDMVDKND